MKDDSLSAMMDRISFKNYRRPSRERGHPPQSPEEVRAKAVARTNFRRSGEMVDWTVFLRLAAKPCVSCGKTPAGGVDHVLALKDGGRNVEGNLQPMCRACNQKKEHLRRGA